MAAINGDLSSGTLVYNSVRCKKIGVTRQKREIPV